MSEGAITPLGHGHSDQVYASPLGMNTMPMLLYPGTSPTPHHLVWASIHTTTLESRQLWTTIISRCHPATSSFRVIHLAPWILESVQYSSILFIRFQFTPADIHTSGSSCCETTPVQRTLGSIPRDPDPSPVPELPRRASTSAVLPITARRPGSQSQLVPHRQYPPPHSKRKGQYVDDSILQAPVLFDLTGNTQHWIAVKDTMNKRYHNLVGRNDPMFEESGSSVDFRFEPSRLHLHTFVASADTFDSGLATRLGAIRYIVLLPS